MAEVRDSDAAPATGDAAEMPEKKTEECPYRTDAHAVVIGINHYQDPAVRDLRFARADAEAIYEILIDPELGRFNPDNVTLLLDEHATNRQIRSAIGTQLPRRAGENDTVYIYYAGHGAPVINPGAHARDGLEKYLIPHDAELDDLRATGIPMDDIQKFFGWIASRQLLFFIDSCYSGVAGGRTLAQPDYQPRAALTDEFLDELAGEGRCIVTACGINEVSIESPKVGHGLFTYYLAEGLRGAADADNDGLVTIQELYSYIYEHVTKRARSLGASMRPIQKGFVQGLVYLTRYETDEQKRARELDTEAEACFGAGDLPRARSSWEAALGLVPDHAGAQQGLARIKRRQLEQQKRRKQAERDRQRVLAAKQRVLLRNYQAKKLPLAEYKRGMTLLGKDPSTMTEMESQIRHFLDLFTSKEIGAPIYLESIRLLTEETSEEDAHGDDTIRKLKELEARADPERAQGTEAQRESDDVKRSKARVEARPETVETERETTTARRRRARPRPPRETEANRERKLAAQFEQAIQVLESKKEGGREDTDLAGGDLGVAPAEAVVEQERADLSAEAPAMGTPRPDSFPEPIRRTGKGGLGKTAGAANKPEDLPR